MLICLFRWCDGPGTTGGRGPKEKEGERGAHVSGCPTPFPSPFLRRRGERLSMKIFNSWNRSSCHLSYGSLLGALLLSIAATCTSSMLLVLLMSYGSFT